MLRMLCCPQGRQRPGADAIWGELRTKGREGAGAGCWKVLCADAAHAAALPVRATLSLSPLPAHPGSLHIVPMMQTMRSTADSGVLLCLAPCRVYSRTIEAEQRRLEAEQQVLDAEEHHLLHQQQQQRQQQRSQQQFASLLAREAVKLPPPVSAYHRRVGRRTAAKRGRHMAAAAEEEDDDKEEEAARHPRGWSPQLRGQQQQQHQYELDEQQRAQQRRAPMQALRPLHWGATGLRSTIVLTAEGLPPGMVLAGGGPAALDALRTSLRRSRSGSLEAISPFQQQQQQQQQQRQSPQPRQQSPQLRDPRRLWDARDESRRTPRQATVRRKGGDVAILRTESAQRLRPPASLCKPPCLAVRS